MEHNPSNTNNNINSTNSNSLDRRTVQTNNNGLQKGNNDTNNTNTNKPKPKRGRHILEWYRDTKNKYWIEPLQKKIDKKYKEKIIKNLEIINKEWEIYYRGEPISIEAIKNKDITDLKKILEETLKDIEKTIE